MPGVIVVAWVQGNRRPLVLWMMTGLLAVLWLPTAAAVLHEK
jgi:hypothetical protein